MTFAEKLRELRTRAGLTQEGLAAGSGLPLGSIRNYEQGQREPLWAVLFKLCRALGVSSEEFADCDDAEGPAPIRGRPRKGKAEAPGPKRPGLAFQTSKRKKG